MCSAWMSLAAVIPARNWRMKGRSLAIAILSYPILDNSNYTNDEAENSEPCNEGGEEVIQPLDHRVSRSSIPVSRNPFRVVDAAHRDRRECERSGTGRHRTCRRTARWTCGRTLSVEH